ncbi:unnamed protein product, partial [Callosobruchus maculatus]
MRLILLQTREWCRLRYLSNLTRTRKRKRRP